MICQKTFYMDLTCKKHVRSGEFLDRKPDRDHVKVFWQIIYK